MTTTQLEAELAEAFKALCDTFNRLSGGQASNAEWKAHVANRKRLDKAIKDFEATLPKVNLPGRRPATQRTGTTIVSGGTGRLRTR